MFKEPKKSSQTRLSKDSFMNLTYRKAQIDDAPVLFKAEQDISRTPGQFVSLPEELNVHMFEQKIEKLRQIENGMYIVAELKGSIVAHALLDPLPLARLSHVTQLNIAVYPGNQGKGIGEALLTELIKIARSTHKIEKIELHVRSSNHRAISLYHKLGFIEEGRWRNRVKLNQNEYLDDVLMGLWLNMLPET